MTKECTLKSNPGGPSLHASASILSHRLLERQGEESGVGRLQIQDICSSRYLGITRKFDSVLCGTMKGGPASAIIR